MTAVFDGVTSSAIGNIEVKPDPEMYSVGTIDFQYPFEKTITLQVCYPIYARKNCTYRHVADPMQNVALIMIIQNFLSSIFLHISPMHEL